MSLNKSHYNYIEMSKIYKCNVCNYESLRFSNYERHLKSQKHLTNYNRLIKDSKKTHLGLINESSLKTKTKEFLCRKCNKVHIQIEKKQEFKCKSENNKLKEKMSIIFILSDLVSYINTERLD
jgi:hypothetical protein